MVCWWNPEMRLRLRCINTLKENIGYFLQETNPNRKAGYQDSVRQLLKKTGFRTLKNVVDLKRNMDNAYKQP